MCANEPHSFKNLRKCAATQSTHDNRMASIDETNGNNPVGKETIWTFLKSLCSAIYAVLLIVEFSFIDLYILWGKYLIQLTPGFIGVKI